MENASAQALSIEWSPIPVAQKGFGPRHKIASDFSWEMMDTDVGGGWIRWQPGYGPAGVEADENWHQILSTGRFPAAFLMPQRGAGPEGSPTGDPSGSNGVWDSCISPSDPTRGYLIWHGFLFKTLDRGKTWAHVPGWAGADLNSNGGDQRLRALRLVVDPINPDVLYMGCSDDSGLWRSLNAGDNWTNIATVPGYRTIVTGTGTISNGASASGNILNFPTAPTGTVTAGLAVLGLGGDFPVTINAYGSGGTTGTGGAGTYQLSGSALVASSTIKLVLQKKFRWMTIIIDPASTPVSGRCSVVRCAVAGAGVFKSTDGGGTFAAESGSPLSVQDMAMDSTGRVYIAAASDVISAGVLTGTGTNAGLWTLDGSTFTNRGLFGLDAASYVGVNPTSDNDIWLHNGTGVIVRITNRTTFASVGPWAKPTAMRVISHFNSLAAAAVNAQLVANVVVNMCKPSFHPDGTKMWLPGGFMLGRIDLAEVPATAVPWLNIHEDCASIEELVGHGARWLPNDNIVVYGQDRGAITSKKPANKFRKRQPAAISPVNTTIQQSFSADYCYNDPLKAVFISQGDVWGSRDGANSWTALSTGASARAGWAIPTGGDSILWMPGLNRNGLYSPDWGATWVMPTLVGATLSADGADPGWGWGGNDGPRNKRIAQDPDDGEVFAFNISAIADRRGYWRSVDKGLTFADKRSALGLSGSGYHDWLEIADGRHYQITGQTGNNNWLQNAPSATGRYSDDKGANWTPLGGGAQMCFCLAISAPMRGSNYKTVWIIGYVSGVFGLWYSKDRTANWTQMPFPPMFTFPMGMTGSPNEPSIVVATGGAGWLLGELVRKYVD